MEYLASQTVDHMVATQLFLDSCCIVQESSGTPCLLAASAYLCLIQDWSRIGSSSDSRMYSFAKRSAEYVTFSEPASSQPYWLNPSFWESSCGNPTLYLHTPFVFLSIYPFSSDFKKIVGFSTMQELAVQYQTTAMVWWISSFAWDHVLTFILSIHFLNKMFILYLTFIIYYSGQRV